MFVRALSYCNCNCTSWSRAESDFKKNTVSAKETLLIVIVWNLTISNLDNLPAQATERKLTRLLL